MTGYVFMPYVISTVTEAVCGFTSSKTILSRYSFKGFYPKNFERQNKIKNIIMKNSSI
jgi:hypothetical protein